MTEPAGSARTLRRGLLLVAVLSLLATAFELAAERHWNTLVQLVPWVTLVVAAAAIGFAGSSRPRCVLAARVLAGLVLLASAFGVYEHIAVNYWSGQLDQTYSDSWEARSDLSRWLLAATKTVGPTPPLAPAALGQSGLLALLATVRRGRRDAATGPDATV